MSTYNVGDSVRLSVTLTPLDAGVVADVADVSLVLYEPDATETTFTAPDIVGVASNKFRLDFLTTQAGVHKYRWVVTGDVSAVEQNRFSVRENEF